MPSSAQHLTTKLGGEGSDPRSRRDHRGRASHPLAHGFTLHQGARSSFPSRLSASPSHTSKLKRTLRHQQGVMEGREKKAVGEQRHTRSQTSVSLCRDEAGQWSCGLWRFRRDLKQTKASLPSQKPWPHHTCLQKGFLEPETTSGSKALLRGGSQERPTSK